MATLQDMQQRLNELRDPNHVRPPSEHAGEHVRPPSSAALKDENLFGKADRYLHSSKVTDPAEDSPTIERRSFFEKDKSQHQSPDEPITTAEQDAEGKTTRTKGRGRDYKLPRRDISEYLAEKQRLKEEIRRKKTRNCLIAACVLVAIILTVTLVVLLTRSPDEESSVTSRKILILSTVELTSTTLGAIRQTSPILADDPCKGMSCSEHGTCDKGICICDDGHTGASCEVEHNPCASQPCKNNFACIQIDSGYTCECDEDCKQTQVPVNPHIRNDKIEASNRLVAILTVIILTTSIMVASAFCYSKIKEMRKASNSKYKTKSARRRRREY